MTEKDNMELPHELGTKVPSFTEDFGERLATVIRDLGGLKKASVYAGVTDETLANWRDGRSEPRFFGLLGLARSCGKNFDWLANGEDGSAQRGHTSSEIDSKLLMEAIQLVEDWLMENDREIAADKKAEVIVAIYDIAIEGAADGQPSINQRQVGSILRLVA